MCTHVNERWRSDRTSRVDLHCHLAGLKQVDDDLNTKMTE
jgi:hypothetical protein